MSDTKHLLQRGAIWWINKRIPKSTRHLHDDKETLRLSLETTSLRDARKMRDVLVARLHEQEINLSKPETPKDRFHRLVEDMSAVEDSETLSDAFYPKESQEDDTVYVDAYRHVITEAPATPAPYQYSLKDALQGYIEHHGEADGEKTVRAAKGAVDALLLIADAGDMPLTKLNRKLTIEFMQSIMKAGSFSTLKRHLAGLRRLMKYATAIGEYEGPDHFDGLESLVPKAAKETTSYQPLTSEMITNLFNAGEEGTWQHSVPRILAFTGCRIEEIASLRIDDVKVTDAGEMYLDIPKGKTTAASRVVPVHDLIKPLLERQLKSANDAVDKKLVAGDERPLWWQIETKRTRGAIMSNWLSLKKEELFGSKDRCYAWHSLRVMVASAFEELGVPEQEAAKLLGHKIGKSLSYGLYSKTQNIEVLQGHIARLHEAPAHREINANMNALNPLPRF